MTTITLTQSGGDKTELFLPAQTTAYKAPAGADCQLITIECDRSQRDDSTVTNDGEETILKVEHAKCTFARTIDLHAAIANSWRLPADERCFPSNYEDVFRIITSRDDCMISFVFVNSPVAAILTPPTPPLLPDYGYNLIAHPGTVCPSGLTSACRTIASSTNSELDVFEASIRTWCCPAGFECYSTSGDQPVCTKSTSWPKSESGLYPCLQRVTYEYDSEWKEYTTTRFSSVTTSDDTKTSWDYSTDLYAYGFLLGEMDGIITTALSPTVSPSGEPDDESSSGLSGGAVAGIVVGVLAFVALCGAGVFFQCWFRRRKLAASSGEGQHLQGPGVVVSDNGEKGAGMHARQQDYVADAQELPVETPPRMELEGDMGRREIDS
ncbi:hypothetical protein MKZ38_009482 [Zalerion maritima]|uniref:Uncharacterized protein n=1 Tax=Zalerion maritima TaxID=339359 RepID=A0AAD5WN43_9PEZI|nr:hypothetical protein MKZ38_009482 [Zalerion maritima]